jgi:hypothetical protein
MTLAIHEDLATKRTSRTNLVLWRFRSTWICLVLDGCWSIENLSIPSRKKAQEGIMSQTAAERTADQIIESAHQASRATGAIADAFEDSVGAVRRAAKQSGDATEEFLNDTTQRFQRHLVLTVAAAFVVGVTSGVLIGWMMRRG